MLNTFIKKNNFQNKIKTISDKWSVYSARTHVYNSIFLATFFKEAISLFLFYPVCLFWTVLKKPFNLCASIVANLEFALAGNVTADNTLTVCECTDPDGWLSILLEPVSWQLVRPESEKSEERTKWSDLINTHSCFYFLSFQGPETVFECESNVSAGYYCADCGVVSVRLIKSVTDPVRQRCFRFLWVMQQVLKHNGKQTIILYPAAVWGARTAYETMMLTSYCHRSTSHQSDSSPSRRPADEAVTALHALTHPVLMGRLLPPAPTDNLILRATWQTATWLSQERLNYLHGSPLSSLNMSAGVFKLLKQKQLQEIIM